MNPKTYTRVVYQCPHKEELVSITYIPDTHEGVWGWFYAFGSIYQGGNVYDIPVPISHAEMESLVMCLDACGYTLNYRRSA